MGQEFPELRLDHEEKDDHQEGFGGPELDSKSLLSKAGLAARVYGSLPAPLPGVQKGQKKS
jgi:hypothetical protein